jgi:hypothetical protein
MQHPARLLSQLHGQRLEYVEMNESGHWWLRFSGDVALYVPVLWRLIEHGRVCATSEDHGHRFGLAQPFDALQHLQRLLGVPVHLAEVSASTTDLKVQFSSNLLLQLITTSAGYEGWSFVVAGQHRVIARGSELLEVQSDA